MKQPFAPLYSKLKQNFLKCLVKLMEYNFSAANVCSNPCVGLLPRIKMSFFLLSINEDELISTPEIITFFPISSPIEKNAFLSNPIHTQNIYTYQHQHVLLI